MQAIAIVDLFKAGPALKGEALAEISQMVADVPWVGTDELPMIMAALTQTRTSKPVRRCTQDFCQFLAYLTDDAWEALKSETAAAGHKLEVIVAELIALGVRCPSEHTCKKATSLWLVATTPKAELHMMPHASRLAMLFKVKSALKSAAARAAAPTVHLAVLPGSPLALQRLHPGLWAAFGLDKGGPGTPRIPLVDIEAFDATWGCRGGMSRSPAAAAAPPPAAAAAADNCGFQMLRVHR